MEFTGDLPDDPLDVLPTGVVGIDIETVSGDPQGDWWNPDNGMIASVQFWWPGWNKGAILTSFRPPGNLQRYLESPKVYPIYHNAPFDLFWLYKKFGIKSRLLGDTKLLAKILQEENTSLRPLLEKYTEINETQLPDKSLSTSDWAQPAFRWTPGMKDYAISDVRHLKTLHEILRTHATVEQKIFYGDLVDILPGLVRLYGPGRGLLRSSLSELDFAVDYYTDQTVRDINTGNLHV